MKLSRTLCTGLFAAFSFSILVVLTSSCHSKSEYTSKVGMIWNTTYHITYRGSSQLGDSIVNVLKEVGNSLSVFDSTSTVAKINNNIIDIPDAHFTKVFNKAKEIYENSNGAFDPTLSPIITAWGFGKGHEATADTARIDSLMEFIGLDKINIVNNRIVKKDKRVQLNLSAIAKGYGCDAVAAMLRRNGVKDYMVEIGGEITVGGESPREGKWVIAIDRPIFSDKLVHSTMTTLSFTDAGLATSGNYRNFHEENGHRFGHTIDPKTGRPARTDVLSVTIIAPTSMEADAYATSCMVLGSAKAKQMIEKLNLAALMVLADGSIWESDLMKQYLNND